MFKIFKNLANKTSLVNKDEKNDTIEDVCRARIYQPDGFLKRCLRMNLPDDHFSDELCYDEAREEFEYCISSLRKQNK